MIRPIQPLLLAIALAAPAASPGTELAALRDAFTQSSAAAATPEFQRYLAALSKLENSLVANKDYPAAIHVQRERLRIAAKIESIGTRQTTNSNAASTSTAIALDLASATTGEGVSYDQASASLVGWTTAGAYAEWQLPDHPAGGYTVELTYACSANTPGTFILSEAFYTLTRKTIPTGSTQKFADHSLGTLRLKSGASPFRITAATLASPELFTLKSVRLIPVKP